MPSIMLIATGWLKINQQMPEKDNCVIYHPNLYTSKKERNIIDHYIRKTRVRSSWANQGKRSPAYIVNICMYKEKMV